MASEGIRIRIDDADVLRALSRAERVGVPMRPLFDDIAAYGVSSTQRRFETETGPDGKKWTPFAASTVRRMPERRKPAKLLRDRNRLYSSIVGQAFAGKALVGTNLAYAAIHQLGGEVKQEARTQTATFRLAKEGAGRKIDKDGNVVRYGSRLRFAKASTRAKGAWREEIAIGERTITIPARPYLGISEADKAEVLAICVEHENRFLGTEGRP